jgi:hypothetical protein
MTDEAWLINKGTKFLQEAIAIRETSLELLECVSTLTKELAYKLGTEGIAKQPNIIHLMERTKELLKESTEITGTFLQPSPNEMLQQEIVGLPNVDVTLP